MFKLSIPQSRIWNAYQHYRFICICAGRRGGKTTIGEVLICRAASEPNQTVWYVAPTYRMAKRLMWRRLKKAINKKLIAVKNEAELSIELVNGSLIQLFGADNPDGLVGEGVNDCFLDEVALMSNLEQIFERSIRPALADKQGSAIFLTTPRGFNYFYNLCSRAWNFPYPRAERVEGNDKWWFYNFTTIEGGNVTAEELADMAATMPKKLYDQEVNAQFTTPANRVYDNYDFAANELDDEELKIAIKSRQLLVGIDFNVNPMNAVIAVAKGDECHVIDSIEVMSSNTDELCQEIKNRYPGYSYMAFPDPSGKARKTSAPVGITDFVILERNGFTVYAPSKAPMIVDRVNAVQAMLCSADGKRRLLVHKRAKTLIRALNGQCYKEGTSIPEKGGVPDLSGACFAAGTLIDTDIGILPIEQLPKSGMVKTFDGSYQPYHSNELKGFSRTVQVTLFNGKIITCTPNHLFLTTEGWIEAANLTGKLLCKTQSSYRKQNRLLPERNGTVKFDQIEALRSITDVNIISRTSIFTDTFGSKTMAKYLKSITSIMSMATHQITQLTISNVFHHQSILAIILENIYLNRKTLNLGKNCWNGLDLSLLNGISHQKVESGTSNTLKKLSTIIEQRCQQTASDAVNCLVKLLQLQCTAENNASIKPNRKIVGTKEKIEKSELALLAELLSSAINTIKQKIAVRNVAVRCEKQLTKEDLSRKEIASFAASNLKLKKHLPTLSVAGETVEVLCVGEGLNQQVYCLTVPEWGCFAIEEDLMVSNCDSIGYLIFSRFNLFAQKNKNTDERVY